MSDTQQSQAIIQYLQDDYNLSIRELEYLPIGADLNTVVYRAIADDGTLYFVKCRRGVFEETTITVPYYLYQQGISQLIPPIANTSNDLWSTVEDYKIIVFPFITGTNADDTPMQIHHWHTLGRTLHAIHQAVLPELLLQQIPSETWSDEWRVIVKVYVINAETITDDDPVSVALKDLLIEQHDLILAMVERAETLAQMLQHQDLSFVLCHADIHCWNTMIDTDDKLYVVDWDTMILAPKERDLMFFGGGLFAHHRPAEEEEALFYEGYGEVDVNLIALAYYRYERIVQDIAAYCEEIFTYQSTQEDRTNGLKQLKRQFQPDDVIDRAWRTEARLPHHIHAERPR